VRAPRPKAPPLREEKSLEPNIEFEGLPKFFRKILSSMIQRAKLAADMES
jgi:hypothetical protein